MSASIDENDWSQNDPMRTSSSLSSEARILARVAFWLFLLNGGRAASQEAPVSPNHPWHSSAEHEFENQAKSLSNTAIPIGAAKIYSLAELIDLAETQNPETRLAWERARAQPATLGVARSELYPTLAATALSQID